MGIIKLHYAPDQLRELNNLLRKRVIQALSGSYSHKEIQILDNYFNDIDTILDKGQFIGGDEEILKMLGD